MAGLTVLQRGWRSSTHVLIHPAPGESGAVLVDASHLVDTCRLIKSPAEIDCFRKAAAISDAAVLETIKAVKVGATDREIAAVALAGPTKRMKPSSFQRAVWSTSQGRA